MLHVKVELKSGKIIKVKRNEVKGLQEAGLLRGGKADKKAEKAKEKADQKAEKLAEKEAKDKAEAKEKEEKGETENKEEKGTGTITKDNIKA